MLLHPVNDLSNITVREVNRSLHQPYCIHVGRDIFSVAIFEWKSDDFLSFQPAVFKITTFDQPSNDYHQFPTCSCIFFFKTTSHNNHYSVFKTTSQQYKIRQLYVLSS